MRTSAGRALAALSFTCCFAYADEPAQSPPGVPDSAVYSSRVEEIEAARKRKAQNLALPQQTGLERALLYVKEQALLDKWKYGWHGVKPRIGALVTGSGFAIGPEYLRDDLAGGNVGVRITTQASAHLYELYEGEISFPKLGDGAAFLS